MLTEELDIAARLVVEEYGAQLARDEFDAIAVGLVLTLGERDRLWARYLLACINRRGHGD